MVVAHDPDEHDDATSEDREAQAERSMDDADEANGEGRADASSGRGSR